MNKKERYLQLIAKVKDKYINNPYKDEKIELQWCDDGVENLCREINLWTYWQGYGYKNKTPEIKYLVIGQDFGPVAEEEKKGTIKNVREMNKGNDVSFQTGVDLKKRNADTDNSLRELFDLIGYKDIDQIRYDDLFFTNFCLGYRVGNYSGNMKRSILMDDAEYLKELVDILEPTNIVCLGFDTSMAVLTTLLEEKIAFKNMKELMETDKAFTYGSSRIYPMAHPGYWGKRNRGADVMKEDWLRMIE